MTTEENRQLAEAAWTMLESEVRNVRADGNLATTEVALTYPEGSSWRGISIFEFRDGKITKEIDYFAQPFEAPAWRAHLVEKT